MAEPKVRYVTGWWGPFYGWRGWIGFLGVIAMTMLWVFLSVHFEVEIWWGIPYWIFFWSGPIQLLRVDAINVHITNELERSQPVRHRKP